MCRSRPLSRPRQLKAHPWFSRVVDRSETNASQLTFGRSYIVISSNIKRMYSFDFDCNAASLFLNKLETTCVTRKPSTWTCFCISCKLPISRNTFWSG
eukprot:497621-Rhodomonas_salina.2